MRIGYFSHTNVVVSETFVYDLILALNQYASEVVFFSGASAGTPIEGITTTYTGYYSAPERGGYLLYKVGQISGGKGSRMKFKYLQRSAQQIIKRYDKQLSVIDVAFVDYGTSSALLYPLLKARQIPYVIRVLGYDVTSAFASTAYKSAFLASCRNAAAIIAISDHLKRLLVLAGVDPLKIRVVRLGIDPQDIQPMEWEERITKRPSIVHLGRLTPKKHPIALIHAFAIVNKYVKDAQLTIIGDGPLMSDLKKRVTVLGLKKKVLFKGALNREGAFPILNHHWVFAQHSVTSITGDQEGFALSPAEAALHELPVVATSHSGITEQVADGETGFLVQEHNYEVMAERIIYLLQHPEEAERMGKAGRQRILALCNPEIQTKKIFALLESACKTSRQQHRPVALSVS